MFFIKELLGFTMPEPKPQRPIPIEQMVSDFKKNHKTAHLFKIDNFSLFDKYNYIDLTSSVFELAGYTWKLMLVRGYDNGNRYVSVYLQNHSSTHKILTYELFAVSQLEPKWHSGGKMEFPPSSPKAIKGVFKLSLCDPKLVEEYFIGDCLMIGLKIHGVGDHQTKAESFSIIEKPPNHKVTWRIPKFSSLDPNKPHHSNVFVVGNSKWTIKIYPRGDGNEKDEAFSVYLNEAGFINNPPKKQVLAVFKVRLYDQFGGNHHEQKRWFYDNISGFYTTFMPLEKLVEPYLVNDKMFVGVEFEAISVSNNC